MVMQIISMICHFFIRGWRICLSCVIDVVVGNNYFFLMKRDWKFMNIPFFNHQAFHFITPRNIRSWKWFWTDPIVLIRFRLETKFLSLNESHIISMEIEFPLPINTLVFYDKNHFFYMTENLVCKRRFLGLRVSQNELIEVFGILVT